MEPNRRWLKVGEIAAYLGIAKGTVYNLCQQGILPYVKFKGVGLRIDRRRVDEMLEANEVIPVEEQLERRR